MHSSCDSPSSSRHPTAEPRCRAVHNRCADPLNLVLTVATSRLHLLTFDSLWGIECFFLLSTGTRALASLILCALFRVYFLDSAFGKVDIIESGSLYVYATC